jgi:hypothetical protein
MRSPAKSIFVLALVCGLVQIFFAAGFGFGASWETVAIARNLAFTGTYGNPFAVGASGPTAVIAPLFPVYLAGLVKIFGDTPAFAFAATLAVALAQAIHAALLPRVSVLFFGTVSPGIVAGVLSAFAFRLIPQWDATFTACVLLLFILHATPGTSRCIILFGGVAGLLLLTNPSSILVTGPWMFYRCIVDKVSVLRFGGFAAIVFLVALPWILRNEVQLGTFSVKDNFGMTAYASNNACAQSSIAASASNGCYDAMHPNKSAAELRLLNELGEAGYDKVRTADTIRWVRTHEHAFLALTAKRIFEFWFPAWSPGSGPRYLTFVVWAATLLSLPGFLLLLRRSVPVAWFLIAVAALYPLLYYVVVSDVRYRYPVLWISLLCAGYLLSQFGFANLASSIATLSFTSASWMVKRPLGRDKVQRKGVLTPSTSR